MLKGADHDGKTSGYSGREEDPDRAVNHGCDSRLAEAARREKVSELSIGRWKAGSMDGGKAALVAGKTGPSSREEQLEAEVAELTQALGVAALEIRVWRKSADGRLGPSRTSR